MYAAAMTKITAPREAAFPGLGQRLRQHRRQRGWTLQRMAEATGVAVSTLSKVERGQMSPTYDKLVQLSQGLQVDIAELFERPRPNPPAVDEAPRSSLTRAGQGHTLVTANYTYRYLAVGMAGKRMIPSVSEVKARTLGEFGPLIRHTGEEFLFVLAGRVVVHVEGREAVSLEPGDSIYFDAALGHAFLSAGEGAATVLVVNSGLDTSRPGAGGHQ